MLADADQEVWQPLSGRDRALIRSLRAGPLRTRPPWIAELALMEEHNSKAEIEAVYNQHGFEGLAPLLAESIIAGDFLP